MIINMAPHAVVIIDADGNVLREYLASGRTIRLKSETVPAGTLEDGTPLSRTVFGTPVGLPEYQEGTWYLVSQLVKSALPERTDLLVPAEVVRDSAGNIVGCKSLGV
jgi:hypothetical protein